MERLKLAVGWMLCSSDWNVWCRQEARSSCQGPGCGCFRRCRAVDGGGSTLLLQSFCSLEHDLYAAKLRWQLWDKMDEEDMCWSLIRWLPLSIQDMINCILHQRNDCLPETETTIWIRELIINRQYVSSLLSFFICMGLCRCTRDSELSFCRK